MGGGGGVESKDHNSSCSCWAELVKSDNNILRYYPLLTASSRCWSWSSVTISWRRVLGVLWKPRQLLLKVSIQRHSDTPPLPSIRNIISIPIRGWGGKCYTSNYQDNFSRYWQECPERSCRLFICMNNCDWLLDCKESEPGLTSVRNCFLSASWYFMLGRSHL